MGWYLNTEFDYLSDAEFWISMFKSQFEKIKSW